MTAAAPPPPSAARLLGSAIRRRRRDTTSSAVLVVGHQLCEAAVPVVAGAAIDRAVATGDGSALLLWLGVVVAVFVALATCGGFGYWLLSRAEFSIRRDLRLRLAARALDPRGGLGARRGETPGELVGAAGVDAARAATVTDPVVLLAGSGAALVGGAAVLLAASPVLAAVVLVGAGVVLVLSQVLSGPLVGRAEREQATLAEATAVATDLVEGLRVVKGIGAEDAAGAGYGRTSRAALAARLHAARAEGAYEGVTTALSGVLLVAVAWVGGELALSGTISVGDLVAAVGLAQFLMEPLERLALFGQLLAGARGAGGRLAHLLAAPPAVTGGGSTADDAPGPVAVAVRRDGLALDVAAGEHLGVVAADPARAEPLLRTLARDDDAGTLLLDDRDAADLDLDAVRRRVVVARHDAVLFEGTVAENLAPADATRDESGWAGVLTASAAADVVAGRPEGLDAEIGERGRSLSGGQRQRLVLARALATEADVLVLHEPTTAVDAATEDRVADGLRRHRAGRTTLLLTASPALLARCDRVVLVDGGGVVAEGTHASLLVDPGYRAVVLG
ncbi:ABC transporter ATP-binding protein [Nocardioides marinquilinus]|uniref:ABC transporter ATP-binding protein n=1 Tax=Nocardioides marinquilinus TaxID=1210400 RepID=A0ABP9PBT9_9ACTN